MNAAVVFALIAVQAVTCTAGLPDLISPQIVGGDEARPHEFPWQVGVVALLEDGGSSLCGGALVAKRWVITAAHCVAPSKKKKVVQFDVILGAHRLNEANEAGRVMMDVPASNAIVNPGWKGDISRDHSNDIALIKLPRDAPLGDTIRIIRLPSEEQKKSSFWRETVTISGWGFEHNSDLLPTNALRKLSSTVVSNFYCKLRFFFLFASDTNICISGWGGKGTCNGDSGGPMVLYEKYGPTLIGVTSFGFGLSCNWGWPSAFTRVTSYLDWVNSHIKSS